MLNYAPIILFVYDRLDHTKKTIESLRENRISMDSDLFIYSDFHKKENDREDVLAVREYIKTIDGFKSISIIYRNENYGLAKNISEGVKEVINKYGKAIILEDDIVTSPYFLKFMNDALAKYQKNKNVWHISGWNYPISTDNLPETFFWQTMNCWGWATWKDRWNHFEKNPKSLIGSWDNDKIKKFNLDGDYDFWCQVTANENGKINTWAVFWYATIFNNNGLCLNPTESLVDNIGNDGSGQNCGSFDPYKIQLSLKNPINLNENVEINLEAVNRVKAFYRSLKLPFYLRVFNKLKRVLK
ncbi:glycosyltransferase family protein [Photobacterium leiognathi]|uniref:glycosyltransferase n=1 Tax=Photobacterium leiognathi TaxID=553611 RepID=UPI002982534C|nr:glycosyltransferase [Photobacterium leiognathi]